LGLATAGFLLTMRDGRLAALGLAFLGMRPSWSVTPAR
jgi:hypothetical protein